MQYGMPITKRRHSQDWLYTLYFWTRVQTVLNEFIGHISVPLRCTVSCSKQIIASHAIWAEGVRLLCLLPPQMVISVNKWRQANNGALWMKPSRNTISFKNSFKVHNSTSVLSIPIGCLICIKKWPNLISLKYKKISLFLPYWLHITTFRRRQNGRHFSVDIFKWISFNENVWILIKLSLKFVTKGPIYNNPTLVLIMACCRPGFQIPVVCQCGRIIWNVNICFCLACKGLTRKHWLCIGIKLTTLADMRLLVLPSQHNYMPHIFPINTKTSAESLITPWEMSQLKWKQGHIII